jgi:hypothetical protein
MNFDSLMLIHSHANLSLRNAARHGSPSDATLGDAHSRYLTTMAYRPRWQRSTRAKLR